MPVYEYACKGCGHEFEREQRISEDPIKKCPRCGALKARRLISRTSFVLKGSGWYSDLYGAPKPAKAGGDDAAPAKADEAASAPSAKADEAASGASETKAPAESKSEPAATPPKKGGKGKKAAA